MRSLLILSFCLLLAACEKRKVTHSEEALPVLTTAVRYAEGFTVQYEGNTKLVEIKHPFQGATSGYKYLLVPRSEPVPPHDANVKVISIPVQSIVCTSTTHVPLLEYLGESNKLIGFPSTDYISSKKIRQRIDSGFVQELGIDKGINLERLAVLKPGLVMGYTTGGDYGQFKKMEELNIPVVLNAEYLERHPLGRAEWIKFMAVFFDKEKEADSVFREIEKTYLETKALTTSLESRPTIISGIVYGDAWFLPGGQNYASRLLKDSGCHYLWENDSTTGFLELSFESVYQKGHDADLWIGTGSFVSLSEIEKTDHRYTRFTAFKQKQLYTYNARIGAKGGSEFLELGYLRPDIILKDLVKIAHPELLPSHQLYFYKRLD